jgi:hypothetical protein
MNGYGEKCADLGDFEGKESRDVKEGEKQEEAAQAGWWTWCASCWWPRVWAEVSPSPRLVVLTRPPLSTVQAIVPHFPTLALKGK